MQDKTRHIRHSAGIRGLRAVASRRSVIIELTSPKHPRCTNAIAMSGQPPPGYKAGMVRALLLPPALTLPAVSAPGACQPACPSRPLPMAMAAPGLALAATLPSHCLVCWRWWRRASYTRTAHRAAGLGSKDLTPRQATNQLTHPPSASRTAPRRCAAPLCYAHPPSPPLRRRTSRPHALVSGRAPPRTCACGHRGSWQLAADRNPPPPPPPRHFRTKPGWEWCPPPTQVRKQPGFGPLRI